LYSLSQAGKLKNIRRQQREGPMKKQGVEIECSKCWYWHKVKEGVGECRANPPISIPTLATGTVGQWLQTRHEDWCGNFKKD
jgi:hypothetical protein